MDVRDKLILVVEDEALVGWDLCDMLQSDGYETIGPAPSVDAAMEIIDRIVPSAAVLDVNLGTRTVWPVARRLCEMHVPIIFATADAGHPEFRESFASACRLSKPLDSSALLQAVANATTL